MTDKEQAELEATLEVQQAELEAMLGIHVLRVAAFNDLLQRIPNPPQEEKPKP
jgi:hypothetical protein